MPTPLHRPKQERRHLARRRTDLPPTAHQNWLIAIIVRNPVLTGMTLALVVSAVALALVISALTGLRSQQHDLAHFQARTQQSRKDTIRATCDAINGNAVITNRQTDYLKQIILTSTTASRPFERIYRKLGLPNYANRLAQAEQLANGLEKRKVPALDCDSLIKQVESERSP